MSCNRGNLGLRVCITTHRPTASPVPSVWQGVTLPMTCYSATCCLESLKTLEINTALYENICLEPQTHALLHLSLSSRLLSADWSQFFIDMETLRRLNCPKHLALGDTIYIISVRFSSNPPPSPHPRSFPTICPLDGTIAACLLNDLQSVFIVAPS